MFERAPVWHLRTPRFDGDSVEPRGSVRVARAENLTWVVGAGLCELMIQAAWVVRFVPGERKIVLDGLRNLDAREFALVRGVLIVLRMAGQHEAPAFRGSRCMRNRSKFCKKSGPVICESLDFPFVEY